MENSQNQALFEQVRRLKLPPGKYALFGSAPLGIRGLRGCRDVDVIVTPEVWNSLNDGTWRIKDTPDGNQGLVKGDVEVWKNWWPGEWDIQALINDAETIDGLPFVRLETVLAWKKLKGREKDWQDIEIIKRYLSL